SMQHGAAAEPATARPGRALGFAQALHAAAMRSLNPQKGTLMTQRLNYQEQSAELYRKFAAFNAQIEHSAIEAKIRDLVFVRASQINGCALCVDMQVKQATIHGERPLRLYHLVVWRESPLFDPREQAALEWTEALTQIAPHGVSDEIYDRVRAQ